MRKSYFYVSLLALVAVGAVAGYRWTKTTSSAAKAPAPATSSVQEDDATLLRRAALERFKNSMASLTYGGKPIEIEDERVKEDIKVRLFKSSLSKKEQMRDPAFRAKAEDDVRMRQPVNATVTWDDLSGNQQLDFLIVDTRACSKAVGATQKLSARELAKIGCIQLPTVQNRWDDDAPLEIKLDPVEEETPTWGRLVQERMSEIAAEQFVASTRAGGL